jgi:hypothetical protein
MLGCCIYNQATLVAAAGAHCSIGWLGEADYTARGSARHAGCHLVHVDLDVLLPLAALRLALQEPQRRRLPTLPQRPNQIASLQSGNTTSLVESSISDHSERQARANVIATGQGRLRCMTALQDGQTKSPHV